MVMQFAERDIISGVVTMGQVLVIAPVLVFGYFIATPPGRLAAAERRCWALCPGLSSGVILAAFVLIGQCRQSSGHVWSTPRRNCTRS